MFGNNNQQPWRLQWLGWSMGQTQCFQVWELFKHNIKASNGPQFKVQMGQYIIFDIPAMGNRYYCDFSTYYFRFTHVPLPQNPAFNIYRVV